LSLWQARLSRFLLTKQLPSEALFVGNRNNMGAEELLTAYAAGERNFSGADLSRANLSVANLSGANLDGARRW
jgi:uncharacterized protein YjbI with pentapeptide repeats